MNLKNEIYFILALVVVLLPVIYFPLSNDHVIFIMGGKTISEGGKLYADFIDIKPPLIYYLFAGLYKIFGMTEIYYRIFDFLWHLITAISIYYVNLKILKKRDIAIASSIIYSLLYSTLNFSQTLQCETLSVLPLIWAIYFYIVKRNRLIFGLIVGFLIGLIVGLKFSLGIIFNVFLIHIILSKGTNKIKNSLIMIAGTFLGFIVSVIPLFSAKTFIGYMDISHYIGYYVGFTLNGENIFANLLKQTGYYFGDIFSILILFLVLITFYNHFRQPWQNRIKFNYFTLLLLLWFLLLLSVLIESKMIPYHFSRIILPSSVFAATGLIYIYNSLKGRFKRIDYLNKIIFLIIILFFIVLSPLPRWLNIAKNAVTFYYSNEEFEKIYSKNGNFELNQIQQRQVGKYIHENANKDDMIIIMAIGSNKIYLYSKLINFSKFAQSQFYLTNYKSAKWRTMILSELNSSDWVLIQINDNSKIIRGIDKSSWTLAQEDKEIWSIISNKYNLKCETEVYKVFQKK